VLSMCGIMGGLQQCPLVWESCLFSFSLNRTSFGWEYQMVPPFNRFIFIYPLLNTHFLRLVAAVAGGMMIAASYSLIVEGASFEPGHMSQLAFITSLGDSKIPEFNISLICHI